MFPSMQETQRPFILTEDERFPSSDESFMSKYMELTSSIAAVGSSLVVVLMDVVRGTLTKQHQIDIQSSDA